jgi:hypothetical protein
MLTQGGVQMKSYLNGSVALLGCLGAFVAGCRDTGPLMPIDLGTTDMAEGTGPGPGGGDMAMKSYTPSSIADMRKGKSGAFELDNVVVLGVTSSTKSPKIYVQDAAGGDFSAMQVKCSGTSMTHPCSVATMAHALTRGQAVTIKGTYIKTASSGFEEFYLDNDNLTSGASGALPTPSPVDISVVTRGASSPAKWFQYVSVMSAPTFEVYDLTPSEMVFKGASACPYQTGFGIIAQGTSGVTAPAACGAMNAQPTGVATPNAAEVLIGTDFYKDFQLSSDCKCVPMFKGNVQVTPAMTSTALSGILVYDSVYMATPAITYQYISPVIASDLQLK